MGSGLRQLSDRERGLLEKLLSVDFPGRDELRTQMASLTAEQIEDDGTLRLRCDSGSPSPSKYLLAMEVLARTRTVWTFLCCFTSTTPDL